MALEQWITNEFKKKNFISAYDILIKFNKVNPYLIKKLVTTFETRESR